MEAAQPDKLWYFKAAPLFAGVGHVLLERLAAASTMRRVRAGRVVYSPGAPAAVVYLLKEGQVRLIRADESGSEATVAVLGPLDLFGEHALAGAEAREERAEAMVESLICDIPRPDFLAALEESPRLSVALRNLFGRRIRDLEARVTDLVFKDAAARLCAVLARLGAEHGRPAGDGTLEIGLKLTARDLGHLAGLSRPTTSHLLAGLRREGLVEGGPRRLRLLRPAELAHRAGRPGAAGHPPGAERAL